LSRFGETTTERKTGRDKKILLKITLTLFLNNRQEKPIRLYRRVYFHPYNLSVYIYASHVNKKSQNGKNNLDY